MGLLLDLANILGGFLLAIGLIDRTPEVGRPLARAAGTIAPFGCVIGVVALVTGGYFLIVHLLDGPGLLHFEVVAIVVGLLLCGTGWAIARAAICRPRRADAAAPRCWWRSSASSPSSSAWKESSHRADDPGRQFTRC